MQLLSIFWYLLKPVNPFSHLSKTNQPRCIHFAEYMTSFVFNRNCALNGNSLEKQAIPCCKAQSVPTGACFLPTQTLMDTHYTLQVQFIQIVPYG